MIILVNDNNKESYIIQKYLSNHFTVLSVYYKHFEIEHIKNDHPDSLVFNCNRFGKTKLELLKTISKTHPEIPIICFTSEQNDLFCDFQNITVLPENNYRILIKKLKETIFREPDWYEKINEIKKYILNNVHFISSVEQIIEKFNLDHRKLSSEFKLKTGQSIQEFITDTRFDLVKDILSKIQELGNYYKIARECGFEDDRNLSYLVKIKTGETTLEYHKELLRFPNDNILT